MSKTRQWCMTRKSERISFPHLTAGVWAQHVSLMCRQVSCRPNIGVTTMCDANVRRTTTAFWKAIIDVSVLNRHRRHRLLYTSLVSPPRIPTTTSPTRCEFHGELFSSVARNRFKKTREKGEAIEIFISWLFWDGSRQATPTTPLLRAREKTNQLIQKPVDPAHR